MSGSCGTTQGYKSGHKIGGLVCDACWLAYLHFEAQKRYREHGTDVGYMQHVIYHEPACDRCKIGYEKKLKRTVSKATWKEVTEIWERYTNFVDKWTN